METLLSLAIGIGLSAACGFRVFVPLLVLSIAGTSGHLRLAPGFEWIGTVPALIAFSTATLLEILAYYIPWLDHLLDILATPAAVTAGVIASASVLSDLPPLLKWSVSLIGGGGVAGTIQGATVLTRMKSTALTGGFGNPVVSTAEWFAALATAVLAVLVPLLCLILIGAIGFVFLRKFKGFHFGGVQIL